MKCCRNQITKLSISGSPNLTHFACFDNFKLKEIEFQDKLSKLTWVDFNNNGLENLNFLSQINSENLKWLFLANNNISEDFLVFSNFTNLQELRIGNERGLALDEDHPEKKNHFTGNLSDYLKNFNKLRYLNIPEIEVGEDLGKNLEKLPNSLEIIWCGGNFPSQKIITEKLEPYYKRSEGGYDFWIWKKDNKDFKNLIDKNEEIISTEDRFEKELDGHKDKDKFVLIITKKGEKRKIYLAILSYRRKYEKLVSTDYLQADNDMLDLDNQGKLKVIDNIEKKLESENPITALFVLNSKFQLEDVFKLFEFPLIKDIENNLQLHDAIGIKMDGSIFDHAAIYVGKGRWEDKEIVHITGEGASRVNWEKFLKDREEPEKITIYRPLVPFKKNSKIKENIDLAVLKNYGKEKYYSLLRKNCEHLANMCVYGVFYSPQSEDLFNSLLNKNPTIKGIMKNVPIVNRFVGVSLSEERFRKALEDSEEIFEKLKDNQAEEQIKATCLDSLIEMGWRSK